MVYTVLLQLKYTLSTSLLQIAQAQGENTIELIYCFILHQSCHSTMMKAYTSIIPA